MYLTLLSQRERPRVSRFVSVLLVGIVVCLVGHSNVIANEDLPSVRELLEIQRKIEATISKAMPAVVAISDGEGFGSGVVISPQGLILTAGHVVNASHGELEIFFPSGVTTTARIVGFNLDVDAAMLQITEAGNWPHVGLAAEGTSKIGDWVVCLGHSGGYEVGRKPPVRTGRILEYRQHLLVTDAALIGGDSGGPLLNLNGEVIGIHSSIGDLISENRHVQIGQFRRDWERMARGQRWGKLLEFKEPAPQPERRVRLGIEMDNRGDRVYLKSVNANSPAERGGLKPGDVLRRVDGQPITNSKQLINILSEKRPGDFITVDIERRDQLLATRIVLEETR